MSNYSIRRSLTALVLASSGLMVSTALGQGGSRLNTSQNQTVPLTERAQERFAKDEPFDKDPDWLAEQRRLPINLKDFVNQELGRKPNEVLEISEITDALDAFERKNKRLIPDRDVLESSSMTAQQLVEALNQRMFRDPSGVKPTPSLPLRGKEGETLANARGFQKQALLNNPDGILGLSRQGLTNGPPNRPYDGSGIYYDSGSARNTRRFIDEHSPLLPSGRDIVARAILEVEPELADPTLGGPFAKYRLTNTPISAADYARLTKDFLNNKTLNKEKWEALDIAIQRLQLNAISEAYSNGQSTLDNRGNRVYSNGQRMFDDNGRPLYPNGKRKFDDNGNALHSNGQRKFNQNGVKLYANGRPKTNRAGIDLFPDANKTRNARGVALYDNGRTVVNPERSINQRPNPNGGGIEQVYVTPSGEVESTVQNSPDPPSASLEGVPLDPRGRWQVQEQREILLYDNGRAKRNDRGVSLYRNGQTRESNRGVDLYDNGGLVQSNRERALSYKGGTIDSREGFQGRPDGIFPLIRIVPARIRKIADNMLQFVADGTGEEESVSVEGAFVGTEGKEVLPADASKIQPNTRGHVVIQQPWRYVDGQSVGAAGPPRLLALFVASNHAKKVIASGNEPIYRLVTGRVAQSSESATSLILPNTGGKPEEFNFSNSIAQKSVGGKITPIAPASLVQGKSVTLLVESTATFEHGKLTTSTPPTVVAAWQDGPRAP
ncbi:hypothetical protein K2Y11_07420 [bacterium]|nr:hypothetical protein [bacterium]